MAFWISAGRFHLNLNHNHGEETKTAFGLCLWLYWIVLLRSPLGLNSVYWINASEVSCSKPPWWGSAVVVCCWGDAANRAAALLPPLILLLQDSTCKDPAFRLHRLKAGFQLAPFQLQNGNYYILPAGFLLAPGLGSARIVTSASL